MTTVGLGEVCDLLLTTGKRAGPLSVRVVEPVLQNRRARDSHGTHAHLAIAVQYFCYLGCEIFHLHSWATN